MLLSNAIEAIEGLIELQDGHKLSNNDQVHSPVSINNSQKFGELAALQDYYGMLQKSIGQQQDKLKANLERASDVAKELYEKSQEK